MNLKKIFLAALLVLMLTVSLIGPASSQGGQEKTKMYSGEIEWVSRDFKYIGINERKVLIPSETKVFDEKGNVLKISDLRSGLYATVELIRNPDGSTEKRVLIKK